MARFKFWQKNMCVLVDFETRNLLMDPERRYQELCCGEDMDAMMWMVMADVISSAALQRFHLIVYQNHLFFCR